jgi:hypothetical protein
MIIRQSDFKKEYRVRMFTAFIWLNEGASDRFCVRGYKISFSIKGREFLDWPNDYSLFNSKSLLHKDTSLFFFSSLSTANLGLNCKKETSVPDSIW